MRVGARAHAPGAGWRKREGGVAEERDARTSEDSGTGAAGDLPGLAGETDAAFFVGCISIKEPRACRDAERR